MSFIGWIATPAQLTVCASVLPAASRKGSAASTTSITNVKASLSFRLVRERGYQYEATTNKPLGIYV
jgi:hypothetical protein